jgi:hypothetical protein
MDSLLGGYELVYMFLGIFITRLYSKEKTFVIYILFYYIYYYVNLNFKLELNLDQFLVLNSDIKPHL